MSITRKFEIAIGVILSVVLIVVCGLLAVAYEMGDLSRARSLFPYPAAWDQVKVGDSAATAAAKCPKLDQSQHAVAGDTCRAQAKAGWWTLHLAYDDKGRVREKRFVYSLGSTRALKEFEFTP